MRARGWSRFYVAALSALVFLELSGNAAAQTLRREVEPGKFLLFRGHVVQEDTLVCRTPEKERELAQTLLRATQALDELELLRQQLQGCQTQTQILRRMVQRRDFVIQKQDSLMQQLEMLARGRRHSLLDRLGAIFDRRTFFLLGFVAGVFAGVQVH